MAWVTVSGASATAWTLQSPSTTSRWQGSALSLSVESRLNRLYPQLANVASGGVPFIWQLSTENPFYVATGSGVFVRSSITESLY